MSAEFRVARSRFAATTLVGPATGRVIAAILLAGWVTFLLLSFTRDPIGSSAVYQGNFVMALQFSSWFEFTTSCTRCLFL